MDALHRELTKVPPDEFVGARSALVRRLRAEGRRDEAAATAKLRRPSPALWAVNALADAAPDPLAGLLRAGEAMRDGTQAALQGRRTDLARLSSDHGRMVEELTARAVDVLASAGRPPSGDTRSRIWTILRAASTDPEAAPHLAEGTLLSEPAAAGFEGMEGFALAAAPPAREKAAPKREAPGDGHEREHERRRERQAHEGERQAHEGERRARELEARATRARELREQLSHAREHLERARAELARAEREERRLARAADEAERAAETLRRELG